MEHETWRRIAVELGIQAIVPFDLIIEGSRATLTALLPQFGSSNGMIVDPDWSIIEPRANALAQKGYGYSCISIDGSSPGDVRDVLIDWG